MKRVAMIVKDSMGRGMGFLILLFLFIFGNRFPPLVMKSGFYAHVVSVRGFMIRELVVRVLFYLVLFGP